MRTMKMLALVLSAVLLLMTMTSTVTAAERVYLPLINQPALAGATTPTVGPDATLDYQVEWVRLWHVSENGGSAHPLVCGTGGVVQVDIFDEQGEGTTLHANAMNGRMNGVQVQVTHRDGHVTMERQTTGPARFDEGVALFAGQAHATVQVVAAADGAAVTSPQVMVANAAANISVAQLTNAGYCTDDASCQALIAADRCHGQFSWGVVFKRRTQPA